MTTEIAKQPIGRPPIYKAEFHIPAVSKLVLAGQKSKAQIARSFGVSESTLRNWSKEDPEFKSALDIVHTAGEAHLTDLLYQMATGEVKGNVTAATVLLNNIYGWRNPSAGNNTAININAEIVNLSYDQITSELQKYLDKMGVRNLAELESNIIDVEIEEEK